MELQRICTFFVNFRSTTSFGGTRGYLNIVEFFIKRGANIDSKDEWGSTPLHLGIF